MSVSTFEPPGILGYQLRLPSFEGPLDVLLRLVERNQLPITDVSLVAVTDQFLVYVRELGGTPPETIAEFASVGSRLILLKSRSLLPRPPASDDESASGELARQLIEYQAVKRAADELAERDRRGEGAFARSSGAIAAPESTEPTKLAAHQPVSLARALRRRLAAIPSPRELVAARPLISLAAMIERVIDTLSVRGEVRFSSVVVGCRDGHELRTAFLAVLVLIRRRVIDAEQPAPFAEITLMRRPATRPHAVGYPAEQAADD